MQVIERLHQDPEGWKSDNQAAKAEVLKFIRADKAKRGDKPAASRKPWQYANSNFGMGI